MSSPRALVVFVALLACAQASDATLYVAASDRSLARSADVIAIGVVRDVESVGTSDGAIRTQITLDVETTLKGRPARTFVVDQPGGALAGRALRIEGAPRYRAGDRRLLFLAAGDDGTLRTLALAMGQYELHARSGGRDSLAERRLGAPVIGGEPVRRQRLSRLVRTITRAIATAPRARAPRARPRAAGTGRIVERTGAFTFMDSPNGRWRQPDLGGLVTIDVDAGGDTGLGADVSIAAVDSALAAWSDVSGATIRLARGDAAQSMPMLCDGLSQILFNDPYGEMPNPSRCSGVLAMGGYCTAGLGEVDVIDGVQYRRILEGNITFSNGFGGCSFWTAENLAEIATHELGHAIGIGHSSELDDEPSAVRKDATMYYRAHFDGRAASVRPDDIAAVRALYPGGDEPPDDDLDRDGVLDAADNCPGDDPMLGLANPAQTDLDGDGRGDVCDPCPLATGDTSCGQLLGSRVRAHAPSGRLSWAAVVDTPVLDSRDTLARVVLVSGQGVLLDSNAVSARLGRGRGEGPRFVRKQIFRGTNATLSLGRTRRAGFRLRMKVRPFLPPTTPVSLLGVNLQVGDHTYTAPLICRPSRRHALSCTS